MVRTGIETSVVQSVDVPDIGVYKNSCYLLQCGPFSEPVLQNNITTEMLYIIAFMVTEMK